MWFYLYLKEMLLQTVSLFLQVSLSTFTIISSLSKLHLKTWDLLHPLARSSGLSFLFSGTFQRVLFGIAVGRMFFVAQVT